MGSKDRCLSRSPQEGRNLRDLEIDLVSFDERQGKMMFDE